MLLLLLLCLGGVLFYLFNRGPDPITVTPGDSTSAQTTTTTPVTPTLTTTTTTATATATATATSTATAAPTIEVPDVVGKTLGEAETILKTAGFIKITVVVTGGGTSSSEMVVTGTNPTKGSKVVATTEIVVTVNPGTGRG